MNFKKILPILIIAGAGWLFYSNMKKKQEEERLRLEAERFRATNLNNGSNDWYKWIGAVIALFGTVSSLWEPGGIFYKSNVPDPRKDPTGWAKVLSQTRFIP